MLLEQTALLIVISQIDQYLVGPPAKKIGEVVGEKDNLTYNMIKIVVRLCGIAGYFYFNGGETNKSILENV